MTNVHKNEIVDAVNAEIVRLGSANKFANKCQVSAATLSQMRNGEWNLISDTMWLKVANKCGYKFSEWNIAKTINYEMMWKSLSEAREECLFLPISYRAGSGKTVGLSQWMNAHRDFTYLIKCRKWAKRDFLENLIIEIGLELPKGYNSLDKLSQIAINFFAERRNYKPTLLLDQANSLRPSALDFLIHLYNELEDEMSVVIVGTENLEKNIKRGVRYNKEGFDEIDSRFGRNYLRLVGNRLQDVAEICKVNGITDKKTQNTIFLECDPISKKIGNQIIKVVEDTRRLRRLINREKFKLK